MISDTDHLFVCLVYNTAVTVYGAKWVLEILGGRFVKYVIV